MPTRTQLPSVTATKIAIATACLFLATGIALITIPLSASQASTSSSSGIILPTFDGIDTSFERAGTGNNLSRNDRYSYVDESACNGNIDYVYSNTNGKKNSFTYSLSSIPDWVIITAVHVYPCASAHTANGTGSQMDVYMNLYRDFPTRHNAPIIQKLPKGAYTLTNTTPTDLPETLFKISYLKLPTITPIVTSSVLSYVEDYIEAGAVYTSGDQGIRVSRMAIQVDYASLAPTNLRVSNTIQPDVASLSWQDNSNFEYGFFIERSTDNTHFNRIDTRPANVTTYNDFGANGVGLAPGTYYYRVSASTTPTYYDSPYTNIASITIPVVRQ